MKNLCQNIYFKSFLLLNLSKETTKLDLRSEYDKEEDPIYGRSLSEGYLDGDRRWEIRNFHLRYILQLFLDFLLSHINFWIFLNVISLISRLPIGCYIFPGPFMTSKFYHRIQLNVSIWNLEKNVSEIIRSYESENIIYHNGFFP